MISANDVTFIVPIYKLGIDRLNNLKFILPHIIKTGARVLVVEQVKESAISLDLKEFNSEHLLYITKSEEFHKTGIINWAVKNHANTKYVWVNDVDFYMKFGNVLCVEWTEDFIKPYSTGKKLTSDDSTRILRGEKINVSYEDESAEYISLYSALSFIFEKEAFLNIGGMDESLFGWGKEDIEFSERVKSKNIPIQEIDHKGIHLWHPTENTSLFLDNTHGYSEEKDMAIVACHFNWCKFVNPTRNLHRFIRQMQIENIPLFGVELSITENFETTGIEGWKQIRVGKENVCFQKEACINLAVKTLVPEKYTKIAWIDHDIIFTNRNWYSDASAQLEKFKVIQLFSHGIKTDRHGRQISKIPGAIFSYLNVERLVRTEWIMAAENIGYPGGAMAARRDMWRHGGLYPYRIMGGGDTAFVLAMLKSKIGWPSNELFVQRHNKWKKEILEYVEENISYIKGDFVHEWHGDTVNRKYKDRYSLLKNFNTLYIELNECGIVHNYGDRTINQAALEYFESRNEDGVIEETNESILDIVVYTCIVGNYDILKEVVHMEKNIEYICFTDQTIESKTWKIKPIPDFLKSFEPAKIARCMKILPHLFLQEYNISLWVDGSIQILGEIKSFIDENLKNYFAIPKHPDRVCVYEEADAIIKLNKDSDKIVEKQIAQYKNKKYPQNNGMVQSGIIIRKHNDKRCIIIGELWWKEVRTYSKRDQLSFNYSIWKKNVIINILNPNIIVGKNFQIWTHMQRGQKKVALRDGYGNMKNYINGEEV